MIPNVSERAIQRGTSSAQNWLDSVRWQIDFYRRGPKRERVDPEFEWQWFSFVDKFSLTQATKNVVKDVIRRLPVETRWSKPEVYSQNWVADHREQLWAARSLLEDELSKLFFDAQLVVRATSYKQFYFPRIDFDDLLTIQRESAFLSSQLPTDYLGLPLKTFDVELVERSLALKVVSTKLQLGLLNSYRQYLVRRGAVEPGPRPGDVVFDCGACIGDVSLLFAGMVGAAGQVHLFDPIPLHGKYCRLQASMNSSLENVFHINEVAVGESSRQVAGQKSDAARIAPGGLAIDAFDVVSLDDYVQERGLKRVDFIKMDIEGAELQALRGAAKVLRDHKPRLAISSYHLPADVWELPLKIKELNPNYRLYFGHHSPIMWESVYYGV